MTKLAARLENKKGRLESAYVDRDATRAEYQVSCGRGCSGFVQNLHRDNFGVMPSHRDGGLRRFPPGSWRFIFADDSVDDWLIR